MTGIHRHIKASLALMLLIGLAAGCATHQGPLVGEPIPAQACGAGDGDSDGDGITNCNDRCPGSVRGEVVDADGCPVPVEPKPYRG